MAQPNRRRLNATDLAALGHCERQALYRHHGHSGHVDPEVRAARRRGETEHARRHREVASSQTDTRCFIATAVYGPDAWQTNALRAWRDRVLMPRRSGRILVRAYYHLSPSVAGQLIRHPRLAKLTRQALNGLVRRENRRIARRIANLLPEDKTNNQRRGETP